MAKITYVIAAIAALGIMFVIARAPDPQSQPASLEGSANAVAASSELMAEAGTLTMDVPHMNCEFSCFPNVKQTLEEATGVKEVTLAAQKEEGTIDNRQVIVEYAPGFDIQAAIASLATAGFDDSDVVQ
jgi:mercuric ion binding protein